MALFVRAALCRELQMELVPLTEEMVLELQLHLTKYHIVALRSDKPNIMQALRQVPAKRRPKVRDKHASGQCRRTRALDCQSVRI